MAAFMTSPLTFRVFYDMLAALDEEHLAELCIVDVPDIDNKAMVLAVLAERLKRGCINTPLHVILDNRCFSSRSASYVDDPVTKMVSFEETPGGERVQLDGRTFGTTKVKEATVEPRDLDDERKLLAINKAAFQALVRDAGFPASSVIFYDGGTPQFAGLSSKAHCMDWKTFRNACQDIMAPPTFAGPIEYATPAEINRFKAVYLSWTPDVRAAYFNESYDAIPAELRTIVPLAPLFAGGESPAKVPRTEAPLYAPEVQALIDMAQRGVLFRIRCGGPLTGAVALPAAVKQQVVAFEAMFGTFDGSLNLLGACFNNVVDFPASVKVANGEFPNARFLCYPTETFKTPDATGAQVCTLDAGAIAAIKPDSLVAQKIAGGVAQWTGIHPRGQTQPLFDVAVLFDPRVVLAAFKIFPCAIVTGPNEYAVGTPFADCGLKLVPAGATKTWLDLDSPYPIGFYSTDAFGLDGTPGGNFSEDARLVLPAFFASVF